MKLTYKAMGQVNWNTASFMLVQELIQLGTQHQTGTPGTPSYPLPCFIWIYDTGNQYHFLVFTLVFKTLYIEIKILDIQHGFSSHNALFCF